MMSMYSLFQGETGLVGDPGKPSTTGSKIEEKPKKYPQKIKKKPFHSNHLQSQHPFCQLSSIYITGT